MGPRVRELLEQSQDLRFQMHLMPTKWSKGAELGQANVPDAPALKRPPMTDDN